MAVTESSSGLRLDVTRQEFERRLAARGHGTDEIDRLWGELAADREPPRGHALGFGPVIAVYLGLLLLVAACVSFLVIYWSGLGAWGVLVAMIPKTVPGFALVGLLGAIALFFSAFVRHWSFTVVGAFGVLTATTSSMNELGGFAPVVIAVVGIALLVVGLRLSRWRESIRIATLARMPIEARRFVQRLAP